MPKQKQTSKKSTGMQPEINIGLVGHVDHGKTTITQRLSGKWTDTHSEEIKRGITIRLGYANTTFYKCPKCPEPQCYGTKEICEHCKSKCEQLRTISLVDAPGHETLMATMLSGSAIMDAALLIIAANEECPQPQTKEHLMALDISGIKNIVIIQNKIDLVSREEALKNYRQIKEFVKGTVAENSPVIPISAQLGINIGYLIQAIEENMPTPQRDLKKPPIMFIARSFDINKPGTPVNKIVGGVLGGAIREGVLKKGDKIEIKPGLKKERGGNRVEWEPVITEIEGIKSGSIDLDEAAPGGSIAVLTKLDPSIVKSDSLTGNILGHPGKLPPVWHEVVLKPALLKRVVGTEKELEVEPIKKGEPLMLNVNAITTAGVVTETKKDTFKVVLKIPVCAKKEDRITISRRVGNRFRLIGYGELQ